MPKGNKKEGGRKEIFLRGFNELKKVRAEIRT